MLAVMTMNGKVQFRMRLQQKMITLNVIFID